MRGCVTRHPQRARPPLTNPTNFDTYRPAPPPQPSQVQNVWKGKKSRENWIKMYNKAKLEAQDELFDFYYPGFQLPRSASFSRYCGGFDCDSLTIRSRLPLRFILFHLSLSNSNSNPHACWNGSGALNLFVPPCSRTGGTASARATRRWRAALNGARRTRRKSLSRSRRHNQSTGRKSIR